MTFRYFAYGSNLWPPQLGSRCPSATTSTPAELPGWQLVFDKPSTDGSTKANLRPDPGSVTPGAIYDVDESDRPLLDAAEPQYEPLLVEIAGETALTYVYEGPPAPGGPYDWYLATIKAGRALHGIDAGAVEPNPVPDAVCPGMAPAAAGDLLRMQQVVAPGLADPSRYSLHPGDLSWWVHHADPRYREASSYWLQGEDALVVIDSREKEISAFSKPGVERAPLIEWAQRRLDGKGVVGWVAEQDRELRGYLESSGYAPGHAFASYRWDLESAPVPEPALPEGWSLRPVAGEEEARTRREASHAAFKSTMDPNQHLERYLAFMRSEPYVGERDLVAVTPEGRIAAFVVWWGDPSGIAQIEPFGTHPDFQGRGVGRALLHHTLREMVSAGMTTARVVTHEGTPASDFYRSAGFEDVGRLHWWEPIGAN